MIDRLVKPVRLSPTIFLIVLAVAGCTATQDFKLMLANPERPLAERELDPARKPEEVLPFYGVKAGDKVADLMAGRGYYTAILSQVVGSQGVVYSANPTARPEWTDRFKKPEFANVRLVEGRLDDVALPQDGSLDFVLIHLNYHDLAPEARTVMNKRVLNSLKRGGVYGVVDHSAKDGSGNEAAKTLHRIDKALVIQEVTAAGFILAGEGQMLRRPEDPRDFSTLKERGKDDRFVLRFEKPK
ncbi:MAG TPA: SAM-dependent methyltransferase [Candidatus Binatia bacterium]|jgi:predicted methyltransferase|nr:SAM-dependent methyltransferase [Candidatus Binatia bacterium]